MIVVESDDGRCVVQFVHAFKVEESRIIVDARGALNGCCCSPVGREDVTFVKVSAMVDDDAWNPLLRNPVSFLYHFLVTISILLFPSLCYANSFLFTSSPLSAMLTPSSRLL